TAGILGRARPVRNFDIDNDILQVLPLGTPGSFFAEYAMNAGALLTASAMGGCGLRRSGGRKLHARRDHDVLRDLLVHGTNEVVTVAVMKRANHGGVGAAHNAHHAAFGTAIRPDASDLDQHPVTVHRGTDRRRRNENITTQS